MSIRERYNEITATYTKFGWALRRLLLTPASRMELGDTVQGVEVREAAADAAWFARPTESGATPWELRSLGAGAYAILEHLDESDPGHEEELAGIEARLIAAIGQKREA